MFLKLCFRKTSPLYTAIGMFYSHKCYRQLFKKKKIFQFDVEGTILIFKYVYVISETECILFIGLFHCCLWLLGILFISRLLLLITYFFLNFCFAFWLLILFMALVYVEVSILSVSAWFLSLWFFFTLWSIKWSPTPSLKCLVVPGT